MYRAGALMKEPDLIQGTKIDVEYLGPLARSQRMEESVAIERLYSLAMNIAQIDPAIMDNIDHDEAVRLRGKLLGVPKTVLRGKDDVEGLRAMRAEQAQMAQMAQEQQALGKAQKDQAQAAKILADPNVSSGLEDTVQEMGMENLQNEYGQGS